MNKSHFITLTLYIACLLCLGCVNNDKRNKLSEQIPEQTSEQTQTCDNEIAIYLQPYNDFPEKQILQLQMDVQNCLDTLIPEKKFKVKTLPNRQLPAQCFYQPRKRYRADSILVYQTIFNNSNYIVGVLNTDISCSAHGYEDFGILGLGSRPGKTAVVSSFRVKNKLLFYKVAVHEFLHTLGMPHCSENDRSCYMCDADKVPRLEKEVRLCESCREELMNIQ